MCSLSQLWYGRLSAFGWRPLLLALTTTAVGGCGGGVASSPAVPPPAPPPAITVAITPSSGFVLLGNPQKFTAAVTNTTNTQVDWSVNGVAGGNNIAGAITADGTYTAPADLPVQPVVTITATSRADTSKSASALLTISSDIFVALTPNTSSVELGAVQAFHAAIASGGKPDASVRWSLAGAACPASCGAIDASGNYTAPNVLPVASSVSVIAQSVADPAKQASATVTVTSNLTLTLAAPATLAPSASAVLTATLTRVFGSQPNTGLTWSAAGSGCNGAACGTLSAVTTQSVGANTSSGTVTYTAPATAPSPSGIVITVTPVADPSKSAQAAIVIQSGSGPSISPTTATLAANHRVTLTAQLPAVPTSSVVWSVNGIAGGSASVGQICAVALVPCQTVTGGTAQVDYLAPGSLPLPNPVTIQAAGGANNAISATAQITVINHVVVTVQPANVTLAPLAQQTFTASVLGTNNQSVTWQAQGSGCATAACGAIGLNGNYTAPGAPPSPDAIQIVAISADDSSQSGAAAVTVATGAHIAALHPASVYAGGADGFTLRVDGGGFAASSPGPGSTLLIAGTPRTTACSSASECTVAIAPADVAASGSISVQVKNPDGTSSNAVSLVVAAPNASDEIISLTTAAPAAAGKDIVVVEPTTAGVSQPGYDVDLSVGALGVFSVASNTCSLAGNPVVIARPATGASTADLCLFSQAGFDASMTYSVSGPGDVTVLSKQPAGLGIIHLTLQVQSSAAAGPRTLFVQNPNLDKTAATGALEVQ
jgi:hypothetical protein